MNSPIISTLRITILALVCASFSFFLSLDAQAARMSKSEIRDYRQKQKAKQKKFEQDRIAAERIVNERNARERKNRYDSGYAEARVQALERMKFEKAKTPKFINIPKETMSETAKEVVILYSQINVNKEQIKRLHKETIELEKKLQKLTQNQYKVDPSGELSRLISIADPNMPQWLDASLLEDIAEIKKDIGKTVKKEMQKKDAPVFIDLSTE